MRFLVIAKSKQPVPPEAALGLFEASVGWVNKHKANGKMESA